ncbi:MAG: signal peptidase II [Deltaproteobacteria bacterium]|nr:signal peptidase II [Deltaproteobacteria bacterium]
MKKKILLLLLPAVAILFLDQFSKWMVVGSLQIHESVSVIEGFFNLVHIRNRGMAFGLLNRPGGDFSFYLLTGATLAAVCLLLVWFMKLKDEGPGIILPLALILGGALGNLSDRIRLREVIDFLDFFVGSYHWPAFNVADSAITVGTFWLALIMLFRRFED